MFAMRGGTMNVVEINTERHGVINSALQLICRRNGGKRKLEGRTVAAVIVNRNFPSSADLVPMINASERPRCVSVKRRNA